MAADPKETFIVPDPKEEVPFLNFAPLQNGIYEIEKQAKAYAKLQTTDLSKAKSQALNQVLKDMERALTRDHGLPRRPWFIHHIYAPGFYTGYGVKTLPGVREAIEQRDFKEAQEQIEILGQVMQGFAGQIRKLITIAEEK